ncbi:MAG: DUF4124 domain-containing protein [Nitrospirota bacterium]
MKRSFVLSSALVPVLASLLLLLADGPALGDLYEWVDKNGTVGYADSLEKVPPEYRAWAYHNRKKVQERLSITTPVQPQSEAVPDPEPSASPQDSFAGWKERITNARAELEKLRAKRQKAQAEYDDLLRQRNLRSYPVDPEQEAKAAATISEIDQRIRDKEYEITSTIPDQARQAGVPSSVLSQ